METHSVDEQGISSDSYKIREILFRQINEGAGVLLREVAIEVGKESKKEKNALNSLVRSVASRTAGFEVKKIEGNVWVIRKKAEPRAV